MATKPTFNKLNIPKDITKETVTIIIGDEIEVEIKQYLPLNDKLKIIQNVINFIHADESSTGRHFKNPVQLEVVEVMEIIRAYTNISFTDKQITDNIDKTYDLLEASGIIDIIINSIPEEEFSFITSGINESVNEYYKYKNSAFGILDFMAQDYSNLNLDVDALREKLQDKDTFKILPDILDNLK